MMMMKILDKKIVKKNHKINRQLLMSSRRRKRQMLAIKEEKKIQKIIKLLTKNSSILNISLMSETALTDSDSLTSVSLFN